MIITVGRKTLVTSSVQKARKVLKVAHHYGTQAGGTLLIASIHARSTKVGWGTAYIREGVRYAVDHEWLEITPNETFLLTPTGFAEMTA